MCRGGCPGSKACAWRWVGSTIAESRIRRRAGAGFSIPWPAFEILNLTPVHGRALGIALAADPFGLIFALTSAVIGAVLLLYTLSELGSLGPRELGGYACLFQLVVAALIGAALTADLINLFVWFEVAALASYGLTAFLLERPIALEAGFKILALTTLARPVLKRRLHTTHVLTNVDALLGDRAIVVSTVDAHGGKIKLRGELWSARAYDETEVLEPGRRVTVMTISGATAVVVGEL